MISSTFGFVMANSLVSPEPGTIIWTSITFIILLVLLRLFAWPAILGGIKDREESIDNALKSAEKAKEEMGRLQADNEVILKEARQERDQLLKDAKEVKEKMIAEAKEKAAEESEKMIQAAKQAIENEKAAAVNDMKESIANLAVEVAEKVLRQKLGDSKEQKDLIDGLVKDLKIN